jgi:hypothetical protein
MARALIADCRLTSWKHILIDQPWKVICGGQSEVDIDFLIDRHNRRASPTGNPMGPSQSLRNVRATSRSERLILANRGGTHES